MNHLLELVFALLLGPLLAAMFASWGLFSLFIDRRRFGRPWAQARKRAIVMATPYSLFFAYYFLIMPSHITPVTPPINIYLETALMALGTAPLLSIGVLSVLYLFIATPRKVEHQNAELSPAAPASDEA